MLDVHLAQIARVFEGHSPVGLLLADSALLHYHKCCDRQSNRQNASNDSTDHSSVRCLRSRRDVVIAQGESQRLRQDRCSEVIAGLDYQLVHHVRFETFQFDAGLLGIEPTGAQAADHIRQVVRHWFQIVPEHPVTFNGVRVLDRWFPSNENIIK